MAARGLGALLAVLSSCSSTITRGQFHSRWLCFAEAALRHREGKRLSRGTQLSSGGTGT